MKVGLDEFYRVELVRHVRPCVLSTGFAELANDTVHEAMGRCPIIGKHDRKTGL